MDIQIFSSLDKVFPENKRPVTEISREQVLGGERFSCQVLICASRRMRAWLSVESELAEYIQVYREEPASCDLPSYMTGEEAEKAGGYLCNKPCLIPDILRPLSGEEMRIRISDQGQLFWIRVDVPRGMKSGSYPVTLRLRDDAKNLMAEQSFTLEVLPLELPANDLIYTQWLHTDCIAAVHDVEIFSPRHWQLIEAYIKTAADCGINMILTPVHTPPLDTEVGTERPRVQLVRMEKTADGYRFDFGLLERWVEICKKYGIRYLEMPHLFSQWGLAFAPNIYVWEAGEEKHMFGWHVRSDAKEYREFLEQYLPALFAELKMLGMAEQTYFHISDEPAREHLENYRKCAALVRGILKEGKIIDAVSDIEYYRDGLVEIPVPASDMVEPFLRENLKERWIYYCCGQGQGVSNRFLAMSSCWNRVMGVSMYKFQITGFLQWGYNFYFSEHSEYAVNPYTTTSADGAFPSGDPFSVYPGTGGALPSIRAFVFYEGLQDMAFLRLLEERTGREHVVGLIDEVAGKDVRFASLPREEDYLFRLRRRILEELMQTEAVRNV